MKVKYKKNILVLGSAGQIGHPLEIFLKKQGYRVTGIDILYNKDHDLRKYNTFLKNAFESADFVYFLAYDIGGSKYLAAKQSEFEFLNNNIKIMQNTFSLLEETKVPFIFASSVMAEMSWSSYGALKKVGEHYTAALGGINARFWNVYGPETSEERSHVITDFIKKAKEKKCIEMLTDGTEMRQFLYTDDCADILHKLYVNFDQAKKATTTIDVSNGKWNSINEIAEIVAEHYNVEISRPNKKDSVQHNIQIEPNLSHLKTFWNIKNATKLEDGIKKMIKYYE